MYLSFLFFQLSAAWSVRSLKVVESCGPHRWLCCPHPLCKDKADGLDETNAPLASTWPLRCRPTLPFFPRRNSKLVTLHPLLQTIVVPTLFECWYTLYMIYISNTVNVDLQVVNQCWSHWVIKPLLHNKVWDRGSKLVMQKNKGFIKEADEASRFTRE